MTIKQQGGVFGRNPTFNDVTIEGELNFEGDVDINSDLKIDGDLEVTDQVGIGVAPGADRLKVANGTFRVSGNSVDTVIAYSAYGIFGTTTNHDLQIRTNNVETGRFKPGVGLAFPSGYGIDFSATSGTGTSELFDDYEEGESGALTMTPATSGTITLNASYDTFKYTKIGDRVTISGQFVVSSVSSPVGANVTLPIPFTSVSGQSKRSGTAAYYYTGGGVETLIPCGVLDGATDLTIHLDASTIVAGHEFWFDVTYQAA